MATDTLNLAEWIGQIPDADTPGQPSKFTGPDPELAKSILDRILTRGRQAILELIDLVRVPGDPHYTNYKAAYVLHGLALYVGQPDHETERRLFAETVASRLGSDQHSPGVKAALIQELEVAGGPEIAAELGKLLTDAELGEPATRALLSIRVGAREPLQRALGQAQGRNRLSLLQALGDLDDPAVIGDLIAALSDPDADVRIVAARGLARQARPRTVQPLLDRADSATGWERSQLTKACLMLAESFVAAGRPRGARRIYTHLRDTRLDAEDAHVRDAAERGLKDLGG